MIDSMNASSILVTPRLLVHLLTPAVAAFADRYPGIRLNLLMDNSSLNLARRDAHRAYGCSSTTSSRNC